MSLSITSTTSSALTAALSATGRQQQVPGHVQTAADALGMSSSDVMAALESGQSLFDVADAQGVSHADLVSALKAGAPEDLQGSSDLDAMIEGLASASGVGGPGAARGAGGSGGPGGQPGPPSSSATSTTGVLSGSLTSAQQTTLDALSDLLGTDSASLMTQLRSGSDLTDLLSQQGVGLDQLSAELEEGLLVDARA